MKQKPILFSTLMVKSILDDRKTQTRRIVKPTSKKGCWGVRVAMDKNGNVTEVCGYDENERCWDDNGSPYPVNNKYQVGDVLWVRETWQHTKCLNINFEDENYGYVYKADDQPWEDYEGWTWKPSIFMPRKACRLHLEITDIKVERLQDISKEDAIAEGIESKIFNIDSIPTRCFKIYGTDKTWDEDPRISYRSLWEKINGPESWKSNPLVWVIKFIKL